MTQFRQENVARSRHDRKPGIRPGRDNVVPFRQRHSFSPGPRWTDQPSTQAEIEHELARLRVAARVRCNRLAASARRALRTIDPDIVRQVAATETIAALPSRLRALIAFVDVSVESAQSIRATHLAALKHAGFDAQDLRSLARVIAAATYEGSFGQLSLDTRRVHLLTRLPKSVTSI
jgi:hypothetical protein